MQKRSLILLLWGGVLISHAQVAFKDSSRIFTEVQLKEDWGIFRRALTESHPVIYRYTSKEKFDHFFDSVNTSFTQPLTEEQFMKFLMRGVAMVRCVHTNTKFSDAFYKIHSVQKETIFPLTLKYIDGEAYILKNTSRDSITNMIGLKVKCINGKPMQFYIDEFFPLLNGDGFIETSRYDQLGNNFKDFYNYFIGRPDTFYLGCENPLTREDIFLKVPSVNVQEFIERSRWRNRTQKLLSYNLLNNETAYLQINSFLLPYLRKKKKAPYKFLKRSFTDIQKNKIKNVIIDLRDNGGGHGEYGAKLFSYLRDSSFFSDRSQVVKRLKFDKKFMKYSAKDQFRSIKSSTVTKTDSGYYALKNRLTGLLVPWKPARHPFLGNVYLLISGSTYSAASQFATTFNAYARGSIIGQEGGGQSYGPNGFWAINIILPNTKARLHIPLVSAHNYSKSYTFGRGIMPTLQISDSTRIKALLEHRDTEIEYTLKLISEMK